MNIENNFATIAQEKDYIYLLQNIRCTQCPNQNIAGSQSNVALEIKELLINNINSGKSRESIINELRLQYGEEIYYAPSFKPETYLLWFMPVIVFTLLCVVLLKKFTK